MATKYEEEQLFCAGIESAIKTDLSTNMSLCIKIVVDQSTCVTELFEGNFSYLCFITEKLKN